MKQNSCIALINEIVHDMSNCFFSKDISEMSENRIIHEIQKVNDVNCTDKHGGTLLHYAAAYRMNKVLAYLISHGADINCQDKRGETPTNIALMNDNPSGAELLLQNGANPSLRDKWGNNALMRAAHYCPDSVFHMLLDAGCDPKEQNNYGVCALNIFEAYPNILSILNGNETR